MELKLVLPTRPDQEVPTDDQGTLNEGGPGTAAESPFIAGTNIQWAWDSTSLGYLKTCPRLYQYQMIDGWASEAESVDLRFGIEIHKAMQGYYKSIALGIPHDDAVHDVVRVILIDTADFAPNREKKPGKYKHRESLIRAIIDVLDRYEEDPAQTYVKDDGEPAVELSFRFELDFGPNDHHDRPYALCGHLDRVVTFQDELFVIDYKSTTQTLGDYYFAGFEPNNQMTLYTLASQVILDAPIKGVIIQGIQLLIEEPRTRAVRSFTYRTEGQLDEWLDDLAFWLGQAELYAEQNYYPQNDTACDKFGGCRFRNICSKSPGVREQFLKSNFVKGERWNPLQVR